MSEFCPPIKKFKGKLQCSVSLAEYTSFRVGGRVDYLAFPVDEEDLRSILALCAAQGVPYFILGNGTNLLVKDGGVQGVAVSLAQGFGRIAEISREEEGGLLLAEAGVALRKLVEFAAERNLAGLEWATGIPGTVGGGLFMNAGAFAGKMEDHLIALRLMDPQGNVGERERSALAMSYRSLALPPGEVILAGKFRLPVGDGPTIRARMEEFLRRRRAKQPLDLPSAGSVFKNPPEGSAGRLIEEVGLKGLTVGGAQVSEKHANFIVNLGQASARDILTLIERIREKVFATKGVRLEMEVQVVGEDE